ncbi:MAG: ParB/RepB/Spo0J family partition protein [Patescibacteria group bacterium]
MIQKKGLGRGLGSLIPKKVSPSLVREENKEMVLEPSKDQIVQIPVEKIEPNPMQPRQVFSHQDLEELIESIKHYGILQPLVVTKAGEMYQLIAGERRWRASKVIGLEKVPVIVRDATEQEKLELSLIENIQRKNLNPIEEAASYQRLANEFNLTQEEIAAKLGKSRPKIANTIRLLQLPEKIQRALVEEKITEGHARVILSLPTEKQQLDFLNKILQNEFTVREAETQARKASGRKPKVLKSLKDPLTEAQKEELRQKLNTKVDIKKSAGRGQILIDFYSEEELGELIKKICD